jgi:sporulation protein YlmC with PRC-barrel domain
MITGDIRDLYGADLISGDGTRVGQVEDIYLDDLTGRLEWAEVKTGFLGLKTLLVPLRMAGRTARGLRVPFDKRHIKAAPHRDPGVELTPADEAALLEYYYGMSDSPGEFPG